MFDMANVSARLQLKQIADKNGNPSDNAIVTISRLHQFFKPNFIRRKTPEGFEIRLEWLGYQATKSGEDRTKVQDELLDMVSELIKKESRQFMIVRNIQ